MRDQMTYEEARRHFSYDPETGLLTWIVSTSNRALPGSVVSATRQNKGKTYVQMQFKYKGYAAHRVIWLWVTGSFPEKEIDHIDGNGTNNRWSNLREVTRHQNGKNMRKRSSTLPNRTGVYWRKRINKWVVQIMVDRKHIHGGYFVDEQEAIAARKALEVEYGFHGNHGSDRPL